MGTEESTYSSIFQALKHPIRRRILRMLDHQPLTYTEILTELGVDNGLLNYHLENLTELLRKEDDGRYRLSGFGYAGLSVLEKVENPASDKAHTSPRFSQHQKTLFIVLAVLLCVSLIGLFSIIRLNNGLEKTISSSSWRVLGQIDASFSSLSNSLLDVIIEEKLTRRDLQRIREEALEIERLSRLLGILDPENQDYWHKYEALGNRVYSFILYIETEVYDLGVVPKDSLVLTTNQLNLFNDFRNLCYDVNTVTWTSTNREGDFKLNATEMTRSLEAVHDFRELLRYGKTIFEVN